MGFGIISGIAIVAFMTQLNMMLYPFDYSHKPGLDGMELYEPVSVMFLSGKLITVIAASFFCGAVVKLIHYSIEIKYSIIASAVMAAVSFIDLTAAIYPAWFWFLSLGLYVPSAMLGYYFMNHIRKAG